LFININIVLLIHRLVVQLKACETYFVFITTNTAN